MNFIGITLLEQGYNIRMDWLGEFARVIIEGVGIIGLGIIVFTLVLKAITLPFDIYQRFKMRKQTLIMRDMKDDLEKLQQQYANDKTMYNTKMMELYKKNGYSMFGACLPMILSIVILIVAFQGFNAYSRYANLESFVNMSNEYNAAILEHGVVGPNFAMTIEEQHEDTSKWLFAKPYHLTFEGKEDDEYVLTFEEGHTMSEDGVVYEMFYYTHEEADLNEDGTPKVDANGNAVMKTVKSHYMRVYAQDSARYIEYIYNLDAASIREEYRFDKDILLADPDAKEAVEKIVADSKIVPEGEETATPKSENTACTEYVISLGAKAAKVWYDAHNPSFLWVKNVWYPDVSYNHPIPDYGTFKSQLGSSWVDIPRANGTVESKELNVVLTQPLYENLTSQLEDQKSEPNGYFILIVLSIGLMVLSQWITMRSQKESNQYQTVDGQGAATQKVMLVMMPIIYAIFAFMYSAAFSIYMTMSSVISLLVTLSTNAVLGGIFKKKEEERIRERYGRKLPWMEKDGNAKPEKGKKDETHGKGGNNDKKRRK